MADKKGDISKFHNNKKDANVIQRSGLNRNDTWNPLSRLQEEMNSLFDDYFDFPPSIGLLSPTSFGKIKDAYAPDIDIVERDKEYFVKLDVPGVKEEDIDISVKQKVLTVKGKKEEEKEEREGEYYKRERGYGSFTRIITLSDNILEDQIKASLKNGVLCITIPKNLSAETEGKKIMLET